MTVKIIREKNPDLPIVILNKPNYDPSRSFEITRRDIIYQTFSNAQAKGDKHVSFVEGSTCFGETDRDACTVDLTHPNDLGFLRMADAITPTLRSML